MKKRIMIASVCSAFAIPALSMDSTQGTAVTNQIFPIDNWWNLDIRTWPVDLNSASYINFINNGGTRRLHPDFGGDSGVGNGIYGMPYAVVSGVEDSDLQAVDFQYSDESDGVDHETNQSFPFYPIPPEAITQPHWVEGGEPGNVDAGGDRHLLIIDQDHNYLYELYSVFYDTAQSKWSAGSGAFFDMNTNNRRPDGWTSADAAGLAIFPGLVRYDEAYNSTLPEIKHAFRVTVRSTNGYVYPASHRAGATAGALPMGARLRLKSTVDVMQRTNDPNVQKIFRAMQKYGLIVADNGSDMFITGTYDTRWNNDILNPAFGNLTANDFEVIQLGYNPSTYPLTIVKSGSGSGLVTSDPAGINCGDTCTANFAAISVTLTAAATQGSLFTGWSGGNCTGTGQCKLTMNDAKRVIANFKKNSYSLLVTKTGRGSGIVTSDPAGINCGDECSATYKPNTYITLTAKAIGDSIFTGWIGGGCAQEAKCSFTLNNNKRLLANFIKSTPDFLITNVTLIPERPTAQSVFSAQITIKNQGTGAADGGTLAVWVHKRPAAQCGSIGDKSAAVGILDPDQSKTLTIENLNAGVAGSKIFRAFVDSECKTTESRENNNQLMKTYIVNKNQ